ncbi:uncharacterized protein METZ01_LOCUS268456 [marine metagenome]|uniref:Ribokinase n=1 Tax=marine metagenome TaxID=408172 RepID=A0A382JW83_9ZZZZ
MPRIVVVGSINLDIVGLTPRLPVAGETVTGAEISRFPGGKGANQALAAQRLGAEVTLVGCVGVDSDAKDALALLREGGVNLEHVLMVDDVATGVALIAVSPSGENQIVVGPGANHHLRPEVLELPDADALICQLEVPIDTVARAATIFEGFFCVNLAPARKIDTGTLQRADLIIVNETEAAWYGEKLGICRGMVATTFGASGAVLTQRGKELARAKPPDVRAIDTTAAGDTFTAALTVALVEGQAPGKALKFACAAGAAATLRPGAQPSVPTREEIKVLL